jgi:lipooligosaccharide transport system permease protein
MRFAKIYDGVLATPVRPMEIAFGELMWAMARGGIYAGAFLVIMVIMNLTSAGLAAIAFLAAMLIGFGFGAVGMAVSTVIRSWQDFDVVATIQVALFLFSATFTPLSAYHSVVVRVVIQLSPLYQSVQLVRGITLDELSYGLLVHVAYLIAMTAVGLVIASRRMTKTLLK